MFVCMCVYIYIYIYIAAFVWKRNALESNEHNSTEVWARAGSELQASSHHRRVMRVVHMLSCYAVSVRYHLTCPSSRIH